MLKKARIISMIILAASIAVTPGMSVENQVQEIKSQALNTELR